MDEKKVQADPECNRQPPSHTANRRLEIRFSVEITEGYFSCPSAPIGLLHKLRKALERNWRIDRNLTYFWEDGIRLDRDYPLLNETEGSYKRSRMDAHLGCLVDSYEEAVELAKKVNAWVDEIKWSARPKVKCRVSYS